MNNGEKNNQDITKSLSKISEYSDAFDNYDDVIRYSKALNMIEKKLPNKKILNFDESSTNSKNMDIKKYDSNNFPEDTNEYNALNINNLKTNYININTNINNINKETESEYNKINVDFSNYSEDITENLNINNIKNEKLDDGNVINEELYSNRDIDKNYLKHSKKESEENFLGSEKNSNIKVTSIKKSANKNNVNVNFDFNLEPLDTISINTEKLNKKAKNKKVKKTIEKLLTFNKFKLHQTLSSNNIRKLSSNGKSSLFPSQFSKNLKRKKDYYEPDFILRKAVIMNGKKQKNKDDSSVVSGISDQINFTINEQQLPINNIIFKNIKIDEISTSHLKKFLRVINVESKRKDPKKNFFKTLIELQNFYIDNSPVWVIKLNPNGKYLAGGCKSGKIKIYEIIDYYYTGFKDVYWPNNIIEYLNFVSQTPYKTLDKHKSDVIDLSWSPFFPNILLSASLDHFVYLWDISQEKNCLIKEFEHSDIVTSVCFNPFFKNVFMSGCLEHFVHIWKFDLYEGLNINIENNVGIYSSVYNNSINKSQRKSKDDKEMNNSFGDADKTNANFETQNKDSNIDYFNIPNKITAVAFFPDGSKIAVGTEKGKIFVYNTYPKINYSHNFFVAKTSFGIFHSGKKVTKIQFLDKTYAIVTTADSMIRYVNMNKGKIIKKYKGYSNEDSMTRAYADLIDDVIIIGGEDGKCYAWKIYEQIKKEKNKIYESFKPFSKETVECSIIANENCYINYMQKILKLTNKILILNIIINGTSNGRLEILLNIKEEEE